MPAIAIIFRRMKTYATCDQMARKVLGLAAADLTPLNAEGTWVHSLKGDINMRTGFLLGAIIMLDASMAMADMFRTNTGRTAGPGDRTSSAFRREQGRPELQWTC
jgi:hypothetical protein